MDAASGHVIGKCYKQHRAVEFKKFLNEIEAAVPKDLDVPLIMDNYATHKTPAIRAWFAKRPRWHVHFTPTGASWMNMVERFFAALEPGRAAIKRPSGALEGGKGPEGGRTERQIKRGAHRSTKELEDALLGYIDRRNDDPKPFKWVRTADQILNAVKRFCLRTSEVGNKVFP